MKLSDLLTGFIPIDNEKFNVIESLEIVGIALDSRELKPGDLFVALAGARNHGLEHVGQAMNNGAVAVLFDPVQGGDKLAEKVTNLPAFSVPDLGKLLGKLAARFYGFPSEQLQVIGITGTNGKTSCSQFLGQMLDDCGIIGTLGWGDWGRLQATLNTTPDALSVQKVLRQFVNDNKKNVAMEVSSHGLDQHRVSGVKFKGAVFTNLSRDHLDYHETMEHYLAAKTKLMKMPGLEYAVINLDDAYSGQVLASIPGEVKVWGVTAKGKTLQLHDGETVVAKNIDHSLQGIQMDVSWRGKTQRIQAPLYGDFNVENLLCVVGVMLANGISLWEAAERIQTVKAVKGRMEPCQVANNKQGFPVFIDYAHTPDALSRVLTSIRPHCQRWLWVVFGCGGNRDIGKRSLMGKIAGQWADKIIVTDDNPRFENNVSIAQEIMAGCKSKEALLIQDRKEAIEYAISHAEREDCVVIAGKGHEDYQEIAGVRYSFSDKTVAESALNKRFAA